MCVLQSWRPGYSLWTVELRKTHTTEWLTVSGNFLCFLCVFCVFAMFSLYFLCFSVWFLCVCVFALFSFCFLCVFCVFAHLLLSVHSVLSRFFPSVKFWRKRVPLPSWRGRTAECWSLPLCLASLRWSISLGWGSLCSVGCPELRSDAVLGVHSSALLSTPAVEHHDELWALTCSPKWSSK